MRSPSASARTSPEPASGRHLSGRGRVPCLPSPHRGRPVGARCSARPHRHAGQARGSPGSAARKPPRWHGLGARRICGRCVPASTRRRAEGTTRSPQRSMRPNPNQPKAKDNEKTRQSRRSPKPASNVSQSDQQDRGLEASKKPKRQRDPEHPTHYEPSGSMPGPQLADPKGQQGSNGLAVATPAGLRRPILARLRRAEAAFTEAR